MVQAFDYVIVGGGSAGCVLAARLSEDPAVQVALLEAGPEDRSALIRCPAGLAVLAQNGQANWAFQTVPQPGLGGRRGYQPRGRVLGGSSSVNAMIYLRGQPADYDGWAAAGNPGWAWTDVLPYFRRAEHNERGADALHGQGGPLNVKDLDPVNPVARRFVEAGVQAGLAHNPDFNGPQQDGVGLYQVTHKAGERCSAARAYLTDAVRARPNLQVLTGAVATGLRLQGRRATGVHLRRGHALQLVEARAEVLLCAGALQSPQLLLLSGIGPADALQALGIPVVQHLPGVGRHLHDHVDVVQLWQAPGVHELFGLSPAGLWRALQGIRDWRRSRSGLLTTNFAEAGAFLRSGPDRRSPDLQLHFVVGQLVDHGRKPVLGHGFSCHVCLLDPASRGSVRLASRDPLAAPLIDPAFLSDGDDLRRLVIGFHRMRAVLQQPALAALGGRESARSAAARDDAAVADFVRAHADTIYHPVGSCRMGPGPLDVVDASLRVHGIDGLRVVDASVMPRIVSGNTNAPTIMLAEKAADLVRASARQTTASSAVPDGPHGSPGPAVLRQAA